MNIMKDRCQMNEQYYRSLQATGKRRDLCSELAKIDWESHILVHGPGLLEDLSSMVMQGVCFYNAELPGPVKDLMETAMHKGILDTLATTTGLAEGVNFPVHCVIIRETTSGGMHFSPQVVNQMAGRAGRTGMVERGRCVMMCSGTRGEKT